MKHLIFSLLFIATSLNLRGQDTIILKNNARMILDTTNMRTIPIQVFTTNYSSIFYKQ
jgi:hypothetical protein